VGKKTFYIIKSTTTGNIDITGFAKGVVGFSISFMNDTADTITFKNQNGDSDSENRFYLPNSLDIVISPRCVITLIYTAGTLDGFKWCCISHT